MKKIKVSIQDLYPLIKETLENDQSFDLTVKGTSMYPLLIHEKSVVTIERFSTLQKQFIYLYKYQDKILLHRYLKSKNGILIFRGDNCSTFEYVDKDTIIGVVTKIDGKDYVINWKQKRFLLFKEIKQKIKNLIRG